MTRASGSQTARVVRAALSFEGRAGRRAVWMTLVALVVTLSATVYIAAPLIQFFRGEPVRSARETAARVAPVLLVEEWLFIWPVTAVLVRRGHDRGYPAARTLAVWTVFLGLGLLAAVLPLTARLALQTALFVYLLADYGCTPGARGANGYGADPRAGAAA